MAGLIGANDSPLYMPQYDDSPASTRDPLRSWGPVSAASVVQVHISQRFSKVRLEM